MDLQRFNALPSQEAERELLSCCSAPRWARKVAAGRPYASLAALQAAARSALDDADLDAALDGHPRIGDRGASGASRCEQSGVAAAGAGVLSELEEGNRAYEQRFGHVYLVCATGRSAEDLLATLQARLGNDPATERGVALAELAAINEIRLDRLVTPDPPA
ncbi:2-oxo-4-hydroxy-4-carboxy-5-ureidoimidazoline decarboxylase [Pseudonocardia alaniniphila]|uniref:2-oxo-4-hydroxy-4-carboxy-5-ureidoimidazoline decarboxylase n=1 Tax=Pseudonocardia alaniniphila TaxID=75291 RepID=A0ABS9T7Q1_9PSEU|nr:2-oxo-4-hydroxy-4-carboxy-5-ureidoimidazoline decarboxylase [Pseudonocardia alaniniphila]MCH6164569.1 2-oxo-4-hydroxy-4-carboxy-5-ureidoimidazoline decarboxylase [Pseudonocardia alaniniphila]